MRKFCESKHIKGKERRIRSMKKSIFSKVGAAAMVLTLVTASLVGGTFAKYTTTVTGKAQVSTAKWDVKFQDGVTEITTDKPITLKATNSEGVVTDKIAPGSFGELELTVNGSGAEVDFDYTVDLKAAEDNTFKGLVFYSDAARENAITFPYKSANGVKLGDTETLSIYWDWKSVESDQSSDGNKTNLTYDLTMTATQKTPTSTEPTVAP